MLSPGRGKRLVGLSVALLAASALRSQSAKPQQKPDPASASGKQLFAARCAACHGLDGKGTERAPNITDSAHVRGMSHTQIVGIIRSGITGTGMPAFPTLSGAQIEVLIHHLGRLGGGDKPAQLPGDPAAGKALFMGKAGCSRCHMVSGEGGFIASNLSEYARGHSAEQVRNAILNPGVSTAPAARAATITLGNGEKYTGRVRNEDNFSIQLQDLSGAFHLIPRADVMSFEYDPKPMMPFDSASILSPKELDDLESFLIDVAGHQPGSGAHPSNEEDCFPSCNGSDD